MLLNTTSFSFDSAENTQQFLVSSSLLRPQEAYRPTVYALW